MTSDRVLPHVALSTHAHNRMALRRTDAAWLADRWSDPRTRVLVVAGNRLRAGAGAPTWVAPAEAPDSSTSGVPFGVGP